ncbi:sarcosine oxidase subunit gamma [Gellertiella hungarica]|uniref:Sarcosine oxidase subunit gamma n=1 Tax=Gellertiella hungarica TaxID=1572859 RepID=A0A7W6J1V0_9HYPH|nr:sarcosine oxidase subunit gamma family protein [Gellertiella hungarica]MBB4063208.1 sarcosine oxidase subunit gamma [Gellertiella hungarica]
MNGPFTHRHPLDGAISANPGRSENHVTVLPEPMVLSVAALPGEEQAVAATLGGVSATALKAVGPGEWLVVLEKADLSLQRDIAERAGALALVTDQSSGRAVLRLQGPKARAILAKIVPLDLHPEAFAIGQSGNTLFAHVSANVGRIGEDEFEIVLMRSFALFAFQELMEMGLEFRLTAGFAT